MFFISSTSSISTTLLSYLAQRVQFRLTIDNSCVMMQILLTEASSLTSRQIATILSCKHHTIHSLSPPGLALTKLTQHVSHTYPVPSFHANPYAWLAATLSILTSAIPRFDILLCTQEQVTILSAELPQIKDTGVKIAVPSFGSLVRVMDKVSTSQTLEELEILQPQSVVLTCLEDLSKPGIEALLPGFAKKPIGTSSTGVHAIPSLSTLRSLCTSWRPFENGGRLLLQKRIPGPLLMICGVFSRSRLVAWHACLRAREGVNGSASVKVSLPLYEIGTLLERMGRELDWHGALSLDAILVNSDRGREEAGGEKRLFVIDINPRIVEPMNGLQAGVDLVQALLDVSLASGGDEEWNGEARRGKEGVVTHQSFLSLLGAAEQGRTALVREGWGLVSGRGIYKGSVEELTLLEGDWRNIILLLVLTVLLFVGGKWAVRRLTGDALGSYTVSTDGWAEIVRRRESRGNNGDST